MVSPRVGLRYPRAELGALVGDLGDCVRPLGPRYLTYVPKNPIVGNMMYKTHADIIQAWPSLSELAEDMNLPYINCRMWRYRSSIPSKHWLPLALAAKKRGIRGITLETLAITLAVRE